MEFRRKKRGPFLPGLTAVRHAIYQGETEQYYMLYNLFTAQSLYMGMNTRLGEEGGFTYESEVWYVDPQRALDERYRLIGFNSTLLPSS